MPNERGGSLLYAWSAAILAIVCAPVAAKCQAPVSAIDLPRPSGVFRVGVTSHHWIDSARPEPGTADERDPRELVVTVFYPAAVDPAAASAPYVSDALLRVNAGLMSARGLAIGQAVRTHAVAGAAVAGNGTRYPILILSTGNGEQAFSYTSLASELASYGNVVAVIAHPGVADVVFPDGRVLRRYARLFDPKPQGWDRGMPADSQVALRRAIYDNYYGEASRILLGDVSFVLDQLLRLDTLRGGILSARLDSRKVVTLGHSYGGNVAVEACARDARVVGCVSFDGGAFGPIREEGLRKPYMLFRPAWDNDRTPRGVAQDQLLGSARALAYEVNIVGAGHRSFMDAGFLAPQQNPPTGADRVLTIVSAYLRAFLATCFDGATSGLLTADSRKFQEVQLRILQSTLTARSVVEPGRP